MWSPMGPHVQWNLSSVVTYGIPVQWNLSNVVTYGTSFHWLDWTGGRIREIGMYLCKNTRDVYFGT